MSVTRHFSDTRTPQGRVRFLLHGGRVRLTAEGPGWSHASLHPTLEEAATVLAAVSALPGDLYREALNDLERRVHLDRSYRGAA